MNTQKQFLRNIYIIYFFTFFTALFSYIIKIFLSKNLSVFEFGILFSFISFFALISIFSDLGISQTLNYFGVIFFEEKKYSKLKFLFYFSLVFDFIFFFIISILIFFLSIFLIENFFKISITYQKPFLIFLVYLLNLNISRKIQNFFVVNQNFFFTKLFAFLIVILNFSLLVFFYFTDFNIFNVTISYTLSLVVLNLIFFFIIKFKFKKIFASKMKFDKNLIREVFKYALLVYIGTFALTLITKIDTIFIVSMLEVSKVSFYEVALSLASIITILVIPFSSMIFPFSTKLIENKKTEELSKILSKVYEFAILFAIPIVLLFVIFPKEIVFFLFGENYLLSSDLLRVLSIAFLISIFYQINFGVLAAMSKLKERNKIFFISAFLNIVLNFIFIKYFGLIGVCYSTILVFLTMAILSFKTIKKTKIKINIEKIKIMKIIFLNFIFFVVVFFLKKKYFLTTIFYF